MWNFLARKAPRNYEVLFGREIYRVVVHISAVLQRNVDSGFEPRLFSFNCRRTRTKRAAGLRVPGQ